MNARDIVFGEFFYLIPHLSFIFANFRKDIGGIIITSKKFRDGISYSL